MSAPAWMPLYVADYLADTGHLSTVEHGAYMLLIMHYWQAGGLPAEDAKLARICRMSTKEWAAVRDTLADFFSEGWRHKRIDEEIANTAETIDKRSTAGRTAGLASAAARRRNAQLALNDRSNDDATIVERPSTPPPTPTPTPEEKTPSLRSGAKARGNRLTEDWQLSAEDRKFARSQGLSDADTEREAAKFRDFWLGKPGKDGAKLDWSATWRNWVRRACEMRGISPAANGKDATDDDWRKRLGFARKERKWAKSRWGPMPNESGCLVPAHMVELTDGTGWAEWGEGS
jgi:uncharacterized protein YdaU (DUF1376 family)